MLTKTVVYSSTTIGITMVRSNHGSQTKSRRPKSANGDGGAATGEWLLGVARHLDGGRRLSAYGKTRAEARDKCLAKAKQAAAGIDVKESRQSLGDYLEMWLSDVVQPQLAPKTYSSYRDTVRKHITPALGRIELGKLTPHQVQTLLRDKEREGLLSPTTIGYIRTVLRIALNRALKWSLVERNVAALTDAPRKVRTERVPLTPEQARLPDGG